ncbi:hypothetical protein [Peptoniphilus sp. HCN-40583]|uniref:hypothetical protein n=1 Tax=Peptoniphilus sp. HCN-40583 TaxID=3134662 RepID=UPI0030C64D31
MNDLSAHPAHMEIGRRYKVTYIAGKHKGETYEGIITGDYELFYDMRLDDGTEQTIYKHHLYPDTTTVCEGTFDGDDCARKLIKLYYDVITYNGVISAGERALKKRNAAAEEIKTLTDEFLRSYDKKNPATAATVTGLRRSNTP